MEFPNLGQPLDGVYLFSVCLHREDNTGIHGLSIHDHRAAAALSRIANSLRSGKE
jgi:hypothetical protein